MAEAIFKNLSDNHISCHNIQVKKNFLNRLLKKKYALTIMLWDIALIWWSQLKVALHFSVYYNPNKILTFLAMDNGMKCQKNLKSYSLQFLCYL